MDQGLRNTQRAPRSCIDCSRRKVRCNKRIPCDVCIRRGLASTCSRERVRVKGRFMLDGAADEPASYEDLLQENAQLRILLDESRSAPPATFDEAEEMFTLDENLDMFDRMLFERLSSTAHSPTVACESDVEFPSRETSEYLLAQGYRTSSWCHFAVHHQTLAREHDQFWESCPDPVSRTTYDPSWLALYFSFISSVAVFNDDVAGYENDISGSRTSQPDRVQKWYDCALFYLHKANFLHVPDLRTVQSIAILTNCFNIVGDFNLYLILIPVAIRIAKILKIDCESQLRRRPLIEQEICRRTWWTLIICEWLPVPYRNPCIHEADFDVNLPAIANDDEIGPDGVSRTLPLSHPRPVHYHIAMIRAAQVKYRFRTALKARPLSRTDVVRLVTGADEDLARIIDDLPPYLHADSDELLLPVPSSPSAQSWPPPAVGESRHAAFSWVPRQRILISLVLLNHRMAINNTLQSSWSDESILLQRIRSICMDSSSAMITLALRDGIELEFLNTWGPLSHLFSAAVTLILEAELNPVRKLCQTLRKMQVHNKVAYEALRIIEELLEKGAN
ncbi:hypothetical protein SEUCBS139899_001949 [Sporothrix eucalyptigena]